MAAHLFRKLIAGSFLLAATSVHGQDRSQYTPAPPTFTERLSGSGRDEATRSSLERL
jgi:hypothetical protein